MCLDPGHTAQILCREQLDPDTQDTRHKPCPIWSDRIELTLPRSPALPCPSARPSLVVARPHRRSLSSAVASPWPARPGRPHRHAPAPSPAPRAVARPWDTRLVPSPARGPRHLRGVRTGSSPRRRRVGECSPRRRPVGNCSPCRRPSLAPPRPGLSNYFHLKLH